MPIKDLVARAAYNARRYQRKKARIQKLHADYYQRHKAEAKARAKQWKAEHHSRVLELNKAEYRRNIERKKAYTRSYAVTHKEQIAQRNSARYLRDRERILAVGKLWAVNNRGRLRARDARRRASELQATPPWLTAEQCKQIVSLYITAHRLEQADGTKRHVDHIYPLQGKTVSGLHVPWNLQILTAKENRNKSNKLILARR